MSRQSIFHLEKFPHFLRRITELNRLYNADDPVHDLLMMDQESWRLLPDDDLRQEALTTRKRVHAIHHNFPQGAPVHEQVAYMLRGFAATRPFSQANFRTGWDAVAQLVGHNGNTLLATRQDRNELGNQLWDRILDHYGNGPIETSRILNRDAIFDYLAKWYKPRIE